MRRTKSTFDAKIVGGPHNGLFVQIKVMSDGERMVTAGALYDISPFNYTLDSSEKTLTYKESK